MKKLVTFVLRMRFVRMRTCVTLREDGLKYVEVLPGPCDRFLVHGPSEGGA